MSSQDNRKLPTLGHHSMTFPYTILSINVPVQYKHNNHICDIYI